MKKLLIILAFMFAIASMVTAQTATLKTLPISETLLTVDTDYTLTNTTTSWFLINAAKDMPTTQDFEVHLDSLALDHTNVAVSLWGRKFSSDTWVQIGSTVNWTGSPDGDTTLIISNTAPNRYRQYKANFLGTGTGTTTIAQMLFKQWEH